MKKFIIILIVCFVLGCSKTKNLTLLMATAENENSAVRLRWYKDKNNVLVVQKWVLKEEKGWIYKKTIHKDCIKHIYKTTTDKQIKAKIKFILEKYKVSW